MMQTNGQRVVTKEELDKADKIFDKCCDVLDNSGIVAWRSMKLRKIGAIICGFFITIIVAAIIQALGSSELSTIAIPIGIIAGVILHKRVFPDLIEKKRQAKLQSLSKVGAEAAEIYEAAAMAGDDYAMYALGLCYQSGFGVQKDLYKAAQWFRQSADEGNAAAMYALGRMYDVEMETEDEMEATEKLPADLYEAAKWYKMAADRGHAKAQLALGVLNKKGIRPSSEMPAYTEPEWH